MSKGRATATFVVTEEVVDSELSIHIVVPSTMVESAINTYTVNGSVALGKAIAAAAVEFASVPTKARAEQELQHSQLMGAGKTAEQADVIMVVFYPEWVR